MSSRLRTAAPSLAAVFLTLALAASLVRAAPAGPPAVGTTAAWPPSVELLVSEVMTGGSSASDEFVELYNAGPDAVDLAGDDVAYVTATGGTVTKKAGWTTTQLLGPGQHLLLANGSGLFASQADLTYNGGLAAAGGSIALRAADGSVIDALGWGTAANGFVEGTVAPAPAAGSSLERLAGGAAGNAVDTNDDRADWFVQAVPDPQALIDPPVVPMPGTPPPATPTDAPTGAVPPTATATPPTATATPTQPASPSSSPEVTPQPPAPTGVLTPGPTATDASDAPMPDATSIAAARAAPPGTSVTIEGVLTTPLGFTDEGHGAFVQDATAGIALYLSGGPWTALPAGTQVRASGTTDQRYSQVTLRLAAAADLAARGPGQPPAARTVATGDATEATEGLLMATSGRVTGAPETLSGGFAVTVDDGSGPLRLVAPSASGIGRDDLARGSLVAVVGVLGQHASGGDASGYRLYLRTAADVQIVAAPSVSPGPGASGGPTPQPSGRAVDAIASLTHLGQHALIEGIVTSAGTVWGSDGRRLTLQDASGAMLVRLPMGARPPVVGGRVEVSGTLTHYLAAPELAAAGPPVPLPAGAAPTPRPITHAPLAGGLRWQLAAAAGTVMQVRHGAASWGAVLRLSDGSRLSIGAPAAALVAAVRIATGDRLTITGIIRPPATGSSDPQLYLMARQPSDVTVLRRATSAGGGGALVAPMRTAASGEVLEADLADLPHLVGRLVRVGGVVITSDATQLLLDDGTAQAVVRLPPDALGSGVPPDGAPVTLVGLVVAGPAGSVAIALRSMADLALAGELVEGSPVAAAPAGSAPPASLAPQAAASSAVAGPAPPLSLAALALAMAAFVLLSASAVTRRRRSGGVDQAWRRRMAGRLAALRKPPPSAAQAGPTDPARSPGAHAD